MFACLQSMGDLILRDMPQLTDLSALGSLAQTGAVTLDNLGITALPALTHVNSLPVAGNPQLLKGAFETFVAAVPSLPNACFDDACDCE